MLWGLRTLVVVWRGVPGSGFTLVAPTGNLEGDIKATATLSTQVEVAHFLDLALVKNP